MSSWYGPNTYKSTTFNYVMAYHQTGDTSLPKLKNDIKHGIVRPQWVNDYLNLHSGFTVLYCVLNIPMQWNTLALFITQSKYKLYAVTPACCDPYMLWPLHAVTPVCCDPYIKYSSCNIEMHIFITMTVLMFCSHVTLVFIGNGVLCEWASMSLASILRRQGKKW